MIMQYEQWRHCNHQYLWGYIRSGRTCMLFPTTDGCSCTELNTRSASVRWVNHCNLDGAFHLNCRRLLAVELSTFHNAWNDFNWTLWLSNSRNAADPNFHGLSKDLTLERRIGSLSCAMFRSGDFYRCEKNGLKLLTS